MTVRSYGEFAANATRTTGKMKATVPGLEGHVHPTYPAFDLAIPDNARVDVWLEEFQQLERDGTLPALSIIRLGGRPHERHARGRADAARDDRRQRPRARAHRRGDQPQPRLEGRRRSSSSKTTRRTGRTTWTRTARWRSWPARYARRGVVDSTLYTTSGVLRTMELILGLPPMSQYDAAATPMYNAFQRDSRRDAVRARGRARVARRDEPAAAPGAAASARMDFDEADMTPELELNEILWQSIHGADAVMPPPVHAAFIRPVSSAGGDDDDDAWERLTRH